MGDLFCQRLSNGMIAYMSEFKIKQKKDINRTLIIRVVSYFLICLFALLTICIFTGAKLFTYKHFFIFSLIAFLISILYAFVVEKAGSFLGGMLSGWTAKEVSLREQLSGDLEKARYSKRNNRFDEALNIINGVLERDEDFPDALFLKAQILWEGFEKPVESKNLFRRVMLLVPVGEHLYRWSSEYIDRITLKDKERAHEFTADKDKNG
jgi:hypothetical protein